MDQPPYQIELLAQACLEPKEVDFSTVTTTPTMDTTTTKISQNFSLSKISQKNNWLQIICNLTGTKKVITLKIVNYFIRC